MQEYSHDRYSNSIPAADQHVLKGLARLVSDYSSSILPLGSVQFKNLKRLNIKDNWSLSDADAFVNMRFSKDHDILYLLMNKMDTYISLMNEKDTYISSNTLGLLSKYSVDLNKEYQEDIILPQVNSYIKSTPLIKAAADLYSPRLKIKALVEAGANINGKNKAGYTALHVAILAKNTAAIKSLLSLNADLSIPLPGKIPLEDFASSTLRKKILAAKLKSKE